MRAAVRADQTLEFGKEWQGQTVSGRYPLQQYLGGSDNSAVFLTHLPADLKTRATIKVIRAAGTDADALVANWKRAAQLSHPHLIRVFDGGKCWLSGNELLYVVSEYADENLAQVVPQRALTESETDATLRPMIAALSYLHEQGLVHGHLRPENVMAIGDQLKLSSDGIQPAGAKATSSPGPYDAPEGQGSPAADVWSLGAMLLECVTQRLPGEKVDVSGVPQRYAEIVRHCLVSDPAKRSTVRDMANAIQGHAPKPSAVEQPKTEVIAPETEQSADDAGSGRSKRLAGLIFVLIVAAILGITFAVKFFNQHSAPVAEKPAPTSPEPATVSSAPAAQAASTPAPTTQTGSVLHEVSPNVSSGALRTIQGRVKVRVRASVDAGGNVADARLVSAGPSQYFARHSMEAAREWKFSPPVTNGQATPSEWNLLFEFSRGGVKLLPEQVKSR